MNRPLPDESDRYAKANARTEDINWILAGTYRRLAGFVKQRLTTGASKVLEVGCATGLVANALASSIPNLDYLGVDKSEALLTIARTKYPKLQFECGDVRDLPAWWDGVAIAFSLFKHIGLHEWDAVVQAFVKNSSYSAFNVPILPRDHDNGTSFHHVYVTRDRVRRTVEAAGHAITEEEVWGRSTVPDVGLEMEDVVFWTRRK